MLTDQTNNCFGCGPANKQGLRLKFFSKGTGDYAVSYARVPSRFLGPPGHLHGGVIATLLDEAMGKANKLAGVVAMTRTMEIDFLRPIPLNKKLTVEGWGVKREGRKHWCAAEIRSEDGEVLAKSKGLFIQVDPKQALQALTNMKAAAKGQARATIRG